MRQSVLAVIVFALSCPAAPAVDQKAIDAAIARGVAALKASQQADGSWGNMYTGATALAGLTLVECGEAKGGKAVKAAAEFVRKRGLHEKRTYCLALCVLFLDRLGEPADTPLIESMIVRLISGQKNDGTWAYECLGVSPEEVKRILGEMDGTRVLRAGGDLKKLPAVGRRTVKDLPESIRDQLRALARRGGDAGPGGDHSNTQFAVLALWAGRRYGVPTQGALVAAYKHFCLCQNADGGWNYTPNLAAVTNSSTATMTCAGVMALAVGRGADVEIKKAAGGKADSADVSKDPNLRAGLFALGTSVGLPVGWNGHGGRPAVIPAMSGKAFYYLWSLERVCMALGLKTVGKKDWYSWGAELLLANQQAGGHWSGEYAAYKADTCFALLFLKKANLAADLGDRLRGLKDPGPRTLKAGGVGGAGLVGKGRGLAPSGIGDNKEEKKPEEKPRPRIKLPPPRKDAPPAQRAARELARGLPAASPAARGEILGKLRDTKGGAYTEALADIIPSLEGDAKKEARKALTLRLTRMTDATLGSYLTDSDAEVRRAAALACGTKGTKAHLGRLVKMLRDDATQVQLAAHAALKALTGKKFGREPGPWERWWKETGRE